MEPTAVNELTVAEIEEIEAALEAYIPNLEKLRCGMTDSQKENLCAVNIYLDGKITAAYNALAAVKAEHKAALMQGRE